MTDVIQVYKSKEFFEKSNYNTEHRKLFGNLKETFMSATGFIEGETLFLPAGKNNCYDLNAIKMIIIQDIDGFNPYLDNKYCENADLQDWSITQRRNFMKAESKPILEFKHIETPISFEIFRIVKKDSDSFDLFVDYVSNSSIIGLPERENHKICILEKGNPVRYKINGKSDFTLSGRKIRTYHEFDYVLEVIGKVDKIEFLPIDKIKKIKQISIGNCKVIDERKILK